MTCGVCLKDVSDIIGIFSEEGKRLEISAIVKQHFWFEPIEDDAILSQICNGCWEQIARFHVFYTNVKNAHKKLSENYYSNQQYTNTHCNEYYPPESGYGYAYNTTAKAELNSDDIYSQNYYPESHIEYPNADPEGLLVESTFHSSNSEEAWNEEQQQQQYSRNVPDKIEKQQIRIKKQRVTNENNLNNELIDDNRDLLQKDYRYLSKDDKVRQDDELIAKYVKLNCEICKEQFKKFNDLSRHYQLIHDITGYVRCCYKKLSSRAYILDHIHRHLDPDKYKCKECDKTFSSQYAIRNHMAQKHTPGSEKIYECNKCSEKFTNEHSLNQHSIHHISEDDMKLYCFECHERYPTTLAIDMHKKVYHDRPKGCICHVCGTIVRGKAYFAKHINEHVFKMGPSVINNPICPICGKSFSSLQTIRHHIRYVHSPVRPHKCHICGKSYKIRQTLKEHMGSHAVGAPHGCSYCPKRFRSSLHLYSHKIRMHKGQYEREKALRGEVKRGRRKQSIDTFKKELLSSYENSLNNHNQKSDNNSIILSENSEEGENISGSSSSSSSDDDDDCYVNE